MITFEPKILGFCCSWCSYAAADLAGVSRIQYSPNMVIVRVMCSGRVDPKFVLEGYLKGADGVMVLGCHIGDCHYITGNYQAMNSVIELKKMLDFIGLNPGRLKLDWASAAEGVRFAEMVTNFTDQIRKLGPLGSAEGMTDEELQFELKAARMATESQKLRLIAGKQAKLTTNEYIHDEIFGRYETDKVLGDVIVEEILSAKIVLLTQGNPMSVEEIAARIKTDAPRVTRYVTALKRKGLLGPDSIKETTPSFVSPGNKEGAA